MLITRLNICVFCANTFWCYFGQICIILGANLSLDFKTNYAETAYTKGAIWDEFNGQY